jgi:HEAT repeat protein
LGNLPKPSKAAIAALLKALDDRDPDIRWAIALLLVRIAKKDTELIDALIQLCAGGSNNQKRMALYAIRDLALCDAASRAALLSALQDVEATVRVAAAISLKSRQDVDDAGKSLLLGVYLNDLELKVRHAVAITLANLGEPRPEFVTALKKNCESENEQIKKAALAALELLEKRGPAPSGSISDR